MSLSRTDITVPLPGEEEARRREDARRTRIGLIVAAITLFWLVVVSLLVGWSYADEGPNPGTDSLAALLTIVLPFVPVVIATRNRMPVLATCYALVTLVMVFPALGIVRGA